MQSVFQISRLVATLLLFPVFASAGNITVPHTFQPNTPAKSSEVNENFTTVYDAVNAMSSLVMKADGEVVGRVMIPTSVYDVNVATKNGYYFAIRYGTSDPEMVYREPVYYVSTDCSGQGYSKLPPHVIFPCHHGLYYTGTAGGSVNTKSRKHPNAPLCEVIQYDYYVFEAFPNDENVTGVPDDLLSRNITFE